MGNVVQKGGTAPWRTLGRAARRLLLRMCRALSGRSVRFSRFFRGCVLQSAVVRGPRPPVLGAKWKRSGGNRELEEGLAGGSGLSGFGRKGGVELVAEKMGESQAGLQTRRPEGRRSLQPFFCLQKVLCEGVRFVRPNGSSLIAELSWMHLDVQPAGRGRKVLEGSREGNKYSL